MSETTTEVLGVAVKPGVTLVTNENIEEYVDSQLPAAAESLDDEDNEGAADASPEALAAAELEKVQAEQAENLQPKEGDTEGGKVYWKGKWVNKSDYSYRMHIKTEAERVAKEEAATAKAEAQTEREAKRALEDRIKELQDKYEPPKLDVVEPEPLPGQFTDINEYSKALKEWTADNIRREEAQKQVHARQAAEMEAIIKTWDTRQEAAKARIPDYAEKIAAATEVLISAEVKQEILESDVGPEILYYLAENRAEAEKIGKMTVKGMLKAFGKLEAAFQSPNKPQPKGAPIAEISRAPAPITPLKNASAPVVRLSGSDEVPTGMTYDQWKKLRVAGKIA